MTLTPVTIDDQIDCIGKQLAAARRMHAKFVRDKIITQQQADRDELVLESIINKLQREKTNV